MVGIKHAPNCECDSCRIDHNPILLNDVFKSEWATLQITSVFRKGLIWYCNYKVISGGAAGTSFICSVDAWNAMFSKERA